jgi:multidrug efflux system membrane fusion protein
MLDNRSTTIDRGDLEQAERGHARDVGRRPRATFGKLALRFGIMAVLLLIVFGGFWYFNHMREQGMAAFFANMKPPPVPVVMAEATSQSVPRTLPGIGSVTAVHQVSVAPEIGGRVTQIMFEAGATVRAGDPLLQLNDQPEQGDLLSFRAQARLAGINLRRATQLASRQYETQANVDTYQSQLDQANAGIAKTEALIAEKLVRAPFSGVLGIRQVDLGQYLNAGTMLVTLTDLDTLYVNFTLPEQNKAALKLGQTVAVAVDAFPGRSFPAQLTTVEPQVGTDTRTIKLQATLKNPDHLILPGMFANAKVVLPPQPDVVTVPETSVDYSLYGDSVFLIVDGAADAEGKPTLKVKRTFVKTGDRFDNKVAILSGLKAGDRVSNSGQLKLNDGAVVTLSDSGALAMPSKVPTE